MHWKHSRFEIAFIILGNCHTYDEAYRVLSELSEDRQFAIDSSLAESKRAQSKVVSAKTILNDPHESRSGKLLAECNIDEQAARKIIAQPCLDEARRELAFIRKLMERLEPLRMFRCANHIAFQALQPLEWKLDLHWKTFNYLCSTGMIPYEHLMMLRMHPESDVLLKEAEQLRDNMMNARSVGTFNEFQALPKNTVLSLVTSEEQLPYLFDASRVVSPALLAEEVQTAITYDEAWTGDPQ